MFLRYSVVCALLGALLLAVAASFAQNQRADIPGDLRVILEKAEQFELLSLNPDPLEDEAAVKFHDWKILGRTKVKDVKVRKSLVAAFRKGVADNKLPAARCFDPRHGIRVTYGGKTADFIICFACHQVETFIGDKPGEKFLVDGSPQALFDKVLKAARVPLADEPE